MIDLHVLRAWSGVVESPRVRVLTEDRVWEVSDRHGRRYALKRVASNPASGIAPRFVDEARIVSYLAQRGLPVAVPVLCDDGRVYAAEDGGIYALTPMLPADFTLLGLLRDEALYHHTGATLARMHVALAECPYGIESPQVRPATFSEAWQRLESGLPAAVFDGLAAYIEPWQEAIIHALDGPHRQRVHGDVHGANILTDDRQVTGIIDVDHLQLAPRSYDLGYYLAFWVHWALGRQEPDRVIQDGAMFVTRHLLAGYTTVTALSGRETGALPALSLQVALALIDHYLNRHGIVEPSWIPTARWISDHPETLAFHDRTESTA
ncbi:MAG: phosphotransferase enzyme family protein [Actinopolymorphaceae bacterium]